MVGILRPHCLFASEAEGRRHANEMNLRKRENQGTSLQHKGWMARNFSPLPPVEGEVFFLTSPFIERGNRKSEVLVRQMSGNATNQDLTALLWLNAVGEVIHEQESVCGHCVSEWRASI